MGFLNYLKISKIRSIILILLIFVIVSIYFHFNTLKVVLSSITLLLSSYTGSKETLEIKNALKIYDLKVKNDFKFECIKSVVIYVQITICIHDINKDIHVSGSIKSNGIWESHMVHLLMNILAKNKTFNLIDIGANLGQYCLYAAKFNRKCIAIEPFYDNIIRFHKSVQMENISNNIILITNGVSDKRGEIKRLQKNDVNVGGQGIGDFNNLQNQSRELALQDKYNLVTILLDDLVTIIPSDFKEAIIKIDIENHEFIAFKKINKLLNRVQIYAIFMEWGDKSKSNFYDVAEFLLFMKSKGYTPKTIGLNDLKSEMWNQWPWDMIWIRNDFKL